MNVKALGPPRPLVDKFPADDKAGSFFGFYGVSSGCPNFQAKGFSVLELRSWCSEMSCFHHLNRFGYLIARSNNGF